MEQEEHDALRRTHSRPTLPTHSRPAPRARGQRALLSAIHAPGRSFTFDVARNIPSHESRGQLAPTPSRNTVPSTSPTSRPMTNRLSHASSQSQHVQPPHSVSRYWTHSSSSGRSRASAPLPSRVALPQSSRSRRRGLRGPPPTLAGRPPFCVPVRGRFAYQRSPSVPSRFPCRAPRSFANTYDVFSPPRPMNLQSSKSLQVPKGNTLSSCSSLSSSDSEHSDILNEEERKTPVVSEGDADNLFLTGNFPRTSCSNPARGEGCKLDVKSTPHSSHERVSEQEQYDASPQRRSCERKARKSRRLSPSDTTEPPVRDTLSPGNTPDHENLSVDVPTPSSHTTTSCAPRGNSVSPKYHRLAAMKRVAALSQQRKELEAKRRSERNGGSSSRTDEPSAVVGRKSNSQSKSADNQRSTQEHEPSSPDYKSSHASSSCTRVITSTARTTRKLVDEFNEVDEEHDECEHESAPSDTESSDDVAENTSDSSSYQPSPTSNDQSLFHSSSTLDPDSRQTIDTSGLSLSASVSPHPCINALEGAGDPSFIVPPPTTSGENEYSRSPTDSQCFDTPHRDQQSVTSKSSSSLGKRRRERPTSSSASSRSPKPQRDHPKRQRAFVRPPTLPKLRNPTRGNLSDEDDAVMEEPENTTRVSAARRTGASCTRSPSRESRSGRAATTTQRRRVQCVPSLKAPTLGVLKDAPRGSLVPESESEKVQSTSEAVSKLSGITKIPNKARESARNTNNLRTSSAKNRSTSISDTLRASGSTPPAEVIDIDDDEGMMGITGPSDVPVPLRQHVQHSYKTRSTSSEKKSNSMSSRRNSSKGISSGEMASVVENEANQILETSGTSTNAPTSNVKKYTGLGENGSESSDRTSISGPTPGNVRVDNWPDDPDGILIPPLSAPPSFVDGEGLVKFNQAHSELPPIGVSPLKLPPVSTVTIPQSLKRSLDHFRREKAQRVDRTHGTPACIERGLVVSPDIFDGSPANGIALPALPNRGSDETSLQMATDGASQSRNSADLHAFSGEALGKTDPGVPIQTPTKRKKGRPQGSKDRQKRKKRFYPPPKPKRRRKSNAETPAKLGRPPGSKDRQRRKKRSDSISRIETPPEKNPPGSKDNRKRKAPSVTSHEKCPSASDRFQEIVNQTETAPQNAARPGKRPDSAPMLKSRRKPKSRSRTSSSEKGGCAYSDARKNVPNHAASDRRSGTRGVVNSTSSTSDVSASETTQTSSSARQSNTSEIYESVERISATAASSGCTTRGQTNRARSRGTSAHTRDNEATRTDGTMMEVAATLSSSKSENAVLSETIGNQATRYDTPFAGGASTTRVGAGGHSAIPFLALGLPAGMSPGCRIDFTPVNVGDGGSRADASSPASGSTKPLFPPSTARSSFDIVNGRNNRRGNSDHGRAPSSVAGAGVVSVDIGGYHSARGRHDFGGSATLQRGAANVAAQGISAGGQNHKSSLSGVLPGLSVASPHVTSVSGPPTLPPPSQAQFHSDLLRHGQTFAPQGSTSQTQPPISQSVHQQLLSDPISVVPQASPNVATPRVRSTSAATNSLRDISPLLPFIQQDPFQAVLSHSAPNSVITTSPPMIARAPALSRPPSGQDSPLFPPSQSPACLGLPHVSHFIPTVLRDSLNALTPQSPPNPASISLPALTPLQRHTSPPPLSTSSQQAVSLNNLQNPESTMYPIPSSSDNKPNTSLLATSDVSKARSTSGALSETQTQSQGSLEVLPASVELHDTSLPRISQTSLNQRHSDLVSTLPILDSQNDSNFSPPSVLDSDSDKENMDPNVQDSTENRKRRKSRKNFDGNESVAPIRKTRGRTFRKPSRTPNPPESSQPPISQSLRTKVNPESVSRAPKSSSKSTSLNGIDVVDLCSQSRSPTRTRADGHSSSQSGATKGDSKRRASFTNRSASERLSSQRPPNSASSSPSLSYATPQHKYHLRQRRTKPRYSYDSDDSNDEPGVI